MTISEKLVKIAENEQKVYDKGKADMLSDFWDAYQNYGNRTTYETGFSGNGWTDITFRPKYQIIVGNAYLMFYSSSISDSYDVIKTIDFSGCTEFGDTFVQSKIQHIGTVNTTSAKQMIGTFKSNYLKIIDKVILKTDGSQTFSVTAFASSVLESVTFEGIIGNNIWFSACTKLTTASLLSILTALSKDSALASGKTITLATAHQAKIEADADCTAQLNAAIAAGWTVAYV